MRISALVSMDARPSHRLPTLRNRKKKPQSPGAVKTAPLNPQKNACPRSNFRRRCEQTSLFHRDLTTMNDEEPIDENLKMQPARRGKDPSGQPVSRIGPVPAGAADVISFSRDELQKIFN